MPTLASLDVPVVMELYNVKTVGRSSIAKEIAKRLNVTVRTAIRKIQGIEKLKREGLYFSVEYSLSKLGLKSIVILSEDESLQFFLSQSTKYFLRSYFQLIPRGIGAVLYAPTTEEITIPNLGGKKLVVELTERMRNKVDLSFYGVRSIWEPARSSIEKSFALLRKDLNRLFKKELIYLDHALKNKEMKFDWIDLAILKELEKDPLQKLEEISKSTKLPVFKLRRHASNHVPFLLRGIRIQKLPIWEYFDAGVLLRIKSRDAGLLACLGEAFMRSPLFPMYSYSPVNRNALLQMKVPFPFVRTMADMIAELGDDYGFDVDTDNVWLFASTGKRYSVPYIKWTEYIPKVKWNVKLVSSMLTKLGETQSEE